MPKGAKSRMRRTETPKPIWIKFGMVEDIPEKLTTHILVTIGWGVFGWRGVKFPPFLLNLIVALTTVSCYRASVWWIWHVLLALCVYMNGKVSMVFNRNCNRKNNRLFEVRRPTGSHIIVKVVLSKKWREIDALFLHTTNRKYHMAYLFVPFSVTLDDLEGHTPNAGLIKCNSTNICATFSTVLTVTALRVPPCRWKIFPERGVVRVTWPAL